MGFPARGKRGTSDPRNVERWRAGERASQGGSAATSERRSRCTTRLARSALVAPSGECTWYVLANSPLASTVHQALRQTVYLTFEGLRDSRTIADKLARVRVALPASEASRLAELLPALLPTDDQTQG